MPRRDPNRRPPSTPRPNRSARRGIEVVFWIVFLLAVGIGGPGALTGLPSLADMVMPTGVLEAQASAGWQDTIIQPLSRVVTHYTPPPVAEAAAAPAPPVAKTRPQPAIAILIDDMGNDVSQNRRAIALPQEVSLSFLPDPSETPRLAEEAHRAGHELLVHVPMESPRDRDGSLRNALRRDLPVEENIRRLDWALSRVPYYAGINNHEGSLFTADRLALIPVAERLYGRGVFFLDSRTTPLKPSRTGGARFRRAEFGPRRLPR
jgi:hypothetical protein